MERGFRRRRKIGSGKELKRRVVRWWKSGGGGEDCECREKLFSVEIVSWLFHFTLSQSRVSDFNLISPFRVSVVFNFDYYHLAPQNYSG